MTLSDQDALTAMGAALAQLPVAMVAVETRGHSVYLNAAARRLLSAPEDRARLLGVLRAAGPRLDGRPAGEAATRIRCERDEYLVRVGRLGGWTFAVLERARHVPPPPTLPTAETLARRFRLTPRECEVAALIARGLRNADIAAALDVSLSTARRHTERILAKLRVRTRAEAGAVMLGLSGEERPTE